MNHTQKSILLLATLGVCWIDYEKEMGSLVRDTRRDGLVNAMFTDVKVIADFAVIPRRIAVYRLVTIVTAVPCGLSLGIWSLIVYSFSTMGAWTSRPPINFPVSRLFSHCIHLHHSFESNKFNLIILISECYLCYINR